MHGFTSSQLAVPCETASGILPSAEAIQKQAGIAAGLLEIES